METTTKISLEPDDNENTTYQNLWDTMKIVQRGKRSVYTKKSKRSQIKNVIIHLWVWKSENKPNTKSVD